MKKNYCKCCGKNRIGTICPICGNYTDPRFSQNELDGKEALTRLIASAILGIFFTFYFGDLTAYESNIIKLLLAVVAYEAIYVSASWVGVWFLQKEYDKFIGYANSTWFRLTPIWWILPFPFFKPSLYALIVACLLFVLAAGIFAVCCPLAILSSLRMFVPSLKNIDKTVPGLIVIAVLYSVFLLILVLKDIKKISKKNK